MVESIVSSFFWRKWNFLQKLQHRWGFCSKKFNDFVQSIQNCSLEVIAREQPHVDSFPILHRAIAYLTENPDPKVEAIVRRKFQSAPPQVIHSYLESVTEFSSEIDNLEILNMAEKIFGECSMKEVVQIELEKARNELVPEIRHIYRDILVKIHLKIEERTPKETSEQKAFWLKRNCEQVYQSILEEFESQKDQLSEEKEICLREILEHLKAQYNLGKKYEELQQIDEELIQQIIKKILPEINFNNIQNPLQQPTQPLAIPQSAPIQDTITSLILQARSLSANLLSIFCFYIYILTRAFGVSKYEKPASLLDAQSQVTFYQTSFTYIRFLTDHYLELFSTRKKAFEFSCITAVSIFLLYRLFKKIQHDSPDFFKHWLPFFTQGAFAESNAKPFRNLTQEAAEGVLQPIFGRNEEMQELIAALSTPDAIAAPRIVIIVGEPGVGKTSLIKELALRIVKQEARTLNHKVVITPDRISSQEKHISNLSKKATSIEETLEIIKGRENDYILYIRLAHQLDKNTLSGLVEKVEKTHLRVVLSITPVDLPGSLASINELVENSLPLHLQSLDSASTICVLTRMISLYNTTHFQTIDPQLGRSIAEESLTLPGVEPHKSIQILLNLMSRIDSFIPAKPPFLELFEQKQLELSANYLQAEEDDVAYSLTSEGQIQRENLKTLNDKIQQLKKQFSKSIQLQQKTDKFLRKKKIIEKQYSKIRAHLMGPNADRNRLENSLYFWLCILKNFKNQESQKIRKDLELLKIPVDISSLESRQIFTREDLKVHSQSIPDSIYPPTLSSQIIRDYYRDIRKKQQKSLSLVNHTLSQDPSRKDRRTPTQDPSPVRDRKDSLELQEDLSKMGFEEGSTEKVTIAVGSAAARVRQDEPASVGGK